MDEQEASSPPPPALKAGDRVRSRSAPWWGIGVIESVNEDPTLSEAERHEAFSLSVVFPDIKVPLMNGGFEIMHDHFARSEVERVED